MALDLPPLAQAANPPAIVAPAERAVEQIHVDSHGYHYTVHGNRLLGADVIRATIEAQATPQQAVDALLVEYKKAGYPLTAVRAEVNNKLIAVRVIHGRITEVEVTPDLTPFFTGLEDRDDLHRDTVLRRAVVAELYAARQGMRPQIGFAPAAEYGGSKMTVTEEPIPGAKPWSASLSFGNLGSRFSSRYTAGASGSVRPGGGVELTANYLQGIPGLTADSVGSQYWSGTVGGSVITPWGVYGASWNGVSYRIGDRSAPLNPEGNIETGVINGSQIAYATETSRVVLSEAFTWVDNQVFVFDRDFELTNQRYGFVSLGATYFRNMVLLGQSASFSVGLTGLQGVSPPKGTFLPVDLGVPNPRFSMIQGSFTYVQQAPLGIQLGLSLSGQYADSTVPQNNQWVIGGFGNLTAWLPAVLVGDSGLLGRASLQSPTYAWRGYGIGVNAFVESGLVRRHYTPIDSPVTRTLADAGIGITGNTPFGTSLAVAYAWPIASRNVDLDAINRNGRANVYFTLSQTF
jgi:hemolysin activation/secretion protein